MNAHSILTGTSAVTGNPVRRSRPFLLWVVDAAFMAGIHNADQARDSLGFVHYSRERGVELALMSFSANAFSTLHRPTALETGSNSRFQAVSEEEWTARSADAMARRMGMTVNLEQVRARHRPFSGTMEAVTLANVDIVNRRAADKILGAVTLSSVGDSTCDSEFEEWLSAGTDKGAMELFLKSAYASKV